MQENTVVNEIQLSYKRQISPDAMPQVTTAESAYKILLDQWDENRLDFIEDFKILLLNRAMKVMGVYHVSSGGTGAAIVDTKLVFVSALIANANSIILAHNHPTGNLKPSGEDQRLTDRLKVAGDVLDIKIQDHLILTREGFYSFANETSYHKVMRFHEVTYEARPS